MLLSVHFIEEAACNMGMCGIGAGGGTMRRRLDTDTDFFIEPNVPFSKYVMSDMPLKLFDVSPGNSLSENVLSLYRDVVNKKKGERRIEKIKRASMDTTFGITVPRNMYDTGGPLTLIIRDPNAEEEDRDPEETLSPSTTDWIYAVPRALTVEYNNPDGFEALLSNNELAASLTKSKPQPSPPKASPPSTMPGSLNVEETTRLNHVMVQLPGFGKEDLMTTTSSLRSSYIVKEASGKEVIFWDPLISVSAMRKAAATKLVMDPVGLILDKTLGILKDGKITISSGADGVSSKGFAWLWRKLPKTEPFVRVPRNKMRFFATKFGSARTATRGVPSF